MKLSFCALFVFGVVGFVQPVMALQTPYERLEELFNNAGTPTSIEQVYKIVGQVKSCAFAEVATQDPRSDDLPHIVSWTERSQSGPEFPAVTKRAIIVGSGERPNSYAERLDSQGLFVKFHDSGSYPDCQETEYVNCRWSFDDERTYRVNERYLLMKVVSGQKISKFSYCWK